MKRSSSKSFRSLAELARAAGFGIFFWASLAGPFAFAEQLTPRQEEEAELRGELQRIVKENPTHAAAQKVLDALNQPENSPTGRPVRNRRERGGRRIVNGMPSRGYPASGALLLGGNPHTAHAWCSGTLVGCDKFLTAAHCIAKNPSPDAYLVYFPELGFFKVQAIAWEKAKYASPIFDIAMLTLETPVEGIEPLPVNTSVKPLNNSIAAIVGFGRTGGLREDYGIKREGSVKTEACPAGYAKKKVICWKFDADVALKTAAFNTPASNTLVSASNTCNADSGGGILMRDTEGSRVVDKVFAVVTGGEDNNCVKDDVSYNLDVLEYRDWIEANGEGRLSSAMCGAPLFKAGKNQAERHTLQFHNGEPKTSVVVEVPQGARELRVGMNFEDDTNGKNAFSFAAYSEADTARLKDVCGGSGEGAQFAFCKVDNPSAGVWTIEVSRKQGAGDVQITALTVGAQ